MLLFNGFMALLLKLVRYAGYLSAGILVLSIFMILDKNFERMRKEEMMKKDLEVERAKSKKTRVKYVDDVVVRNIDHSGSSEESIKENISENVGILDKSFEAVYGFEGEGKDKESELMTYGEELVEKCSDGNMARDAKGDVVEGSKLNKENGGEDNAADDDWEGIERSELEKLFAGAVNYVEYGGKTKDEKLTSLGNDVQMQLYGLHKLALEGPCHEPQPMALKVSARAKWNAWQRLGSMSPEVAMEEYIKILSDKYPGWMLPFSAEDDKDGPLETGVCGSPDSKSSSLRETQANFEVGT